MQRLTSLCYSLVDVPSLFFRVYYRSGKAPVDCVEGAFSCKRSSHWDHQAPVNWTFIWYLCRSTGWTYCFNKEFISQRWGARFNEPLPGLEMRDMKQTVCSQPECLLPSPACCCEHTHARSDVSYSSVLPYEAGAVKMCSYQSACRLSAFMHLIFSDVKHSQHGNCCLPRQDRTIVKAKFQVHCLSIGFGHFIRLRFIREIA